jgi:hypothetical protein
MYLANPASFLTVIPEQFQCLLFKPEFHCIGIFVTLRFLRIMTRKCVLANMMKFSVFYFSQSQHVIKYIIT